jgi:tRNA A37 threonylcarbamoyladenosine dehydratase
MTASPSHALASTPNDAEANADTERRFGGLRRLYGDHAAERIRGGRVAVVGLGGVGSWTAEALARSGVGTLVLIDMDHVAESNINRQAQALGATLGKAKTQAMRERISDIHPGCQVVEVDDFVAPDNWPALLPCPVDAVVDACDQPSAKVALAAWSRSSGVPVILCGAAGGKRMPHRVEVADLGLVTHDPLLASVRQRLRRHHAAPRAATMGLRCVFSREPVLRPVGGDCDLEGNLACHGYGSSVTVTATFGMVAASLALESVLDSRPAG